MIDSDMFHELFVLSLPSGKEQVNKILNEFD